MHEIDLIYIWDIICPAECCACSSLMVLFHLLFCGLHCCIFTKIISVFLSEKTKTKTCTISSEIVFLISFTEGSTNSCTERSFIILSIPTTLAPEAFHLQFCSIHRTYPEGHSFGLKWNSLLATRISLLDAVGASSAFLCHWILDIELKLKKTNQKLKQKNPKKANKQKNKTTKQHDREEHLRILYSDDPEI